MCVCVCLCVFVCVSLSPSLFLSWHSLILSLASLPYTGTYSLKDWITNKNSQANIILFLISSQLLYTNWTISISIMNMLYIWNLSIIAIDNIKWSMHLLTSTNQKLSTPIEVIMTCLGNTQLNPSFFDFTAATESKTKIRNHQKQPGSAPTADKNTILWLVFHTACRERQENPNSPKVPNVKYRPSRVFH